jgi:hypothetical protein
VIWFIRATSALEEAKSRSGLLDEAMRLKNLHGLIMVTLPAPVPSKV